MDQGEAGINKKRDWESKIQNGLRERKSKKMREARREK